MMNTLDNSTTPETTRTTVVHVKDGYDVYIGRAMPGYAPSVFQNKLKVGVDGTLAEVLDKYSEYLQARLALEPQLREALQQLKGKRLGCWCKHRRDASGAPQRCHGDYLVFLLEGSEPVPEPTVKQMSLFPD